MPPALACIVKVPTGGHKANKNVSLRHPYGSQENLLPITTQTKLCQPGFLGITEFESDHAKLVGETLFPIAPREVSSPDCELISKYDVSLREDKPYKKTKTSRKRSSIPKPSKSDIYTDGVIIPAPFIGKKDKANAHKTTLSLHHNEDPLNSDDELDGGNVRFEFEGDENDEYIRKDEEWNQLIGEEEYKISMKDDDDEKSIVSSSPVSELSVRDDETDLGVETSDIDEIEEHMSDDDVFFTFKKSIVSQKEKKTFTGVDLFFDASFIP